MQNPAFHQYLGQYLVSTSMLSEAELRDLCRQQALGGGRMGDILMSEKRVHPLDFYKALADFHGLSFIDLMGAEGDAALAWREEREFYFENLVIPWQREGAEVVIATAQPSELVRQWAAKRFRYYRIEVTTPRDIWLALEQAFAKRHDYIVRNQLAHEQPHQSAKTLPLLAHFFVLAAIVAALFSVPMISENALMVAMVGLNIFFLATAGFKLILLLASFFGGKKQPDAAAIYDSDLPIYTILVPLYKESKYTISHLLESLSALDYPKSKLDIKLLVEADDLETIDIIKSLAPAPYFYMVKVPVSNPRTKPKACNYGLQFARGEFVTIYDAEDQPEPAQLKKVVAMFADSDERVQCVQARLNWYNYRHNWLTRMFALEYASWFHFLLGGLERLNIPIPLGGTSNHFRTNILKKVGAWDPYNVTEDADLGIRLTQCGYRTRVLNSTTLEEAPVSLKGWIGQRSRWIKGYMQTYLVHMRNPIRLMRRLGVRGFAGFVFFVGAPSLVFLLKPLVILLTISWWLVEPSFPDWLWTIMLVGFFSNAVVHLILALCVVVRSGWWEMFGYALMHPFYWVLHTIASFKAIWELVFRPHHWDKTSHGHSRVKAIPPVGL